MRTLLGILRPSALTAALLLLGGSAQAQEQAEPEEAEPEGQAEPEEAEPEGQAEPETEGDEQAGAQKAADGETEATAGPSTPEYAVKVQNGIRLTLARDLDGAIAALREAIRDDPQRPQAHYFLGAALRMKGDLPEALESFQQSARMAGGNRDWQVRGLAGAAMVLEQIAAQRPDLPEDPSPESPRINEPQLERARQAWKRVQKVGQQGARVIDDQVIEERLRAIEEVLETEEKTVEVRKQIAKREKEKAEEEAEDDD